MVKIFLYILIWLLSLIFISIYTYENPERLETVEHYFNKYKKQETTSGKEETLRVPGNSFIVELYKEIAFTEKTAFIVHDENISNFDKNALKIYFQDGSLFENREFKKPNMPITKAPIAINTATPPFPLDILSLRMATFFLSSSIDFKSCFILSAHNFSCEDKR